MGGTLKPLFTSFGDSPWNGPDHVLLAGVSSEILINFLASCKPR